MLDSSGKKPEESTSTLRGSQKSKSLNFAALSDLEWVVYFCRCVLVLGLKH